MWEVLQADGNWEESSPGAWERHLQSSRPPGQALSMKHREKRKLKGKGQAPVGVVGVPVASTLAGRWATCSQRPEILARDPLTSRPTATSLPPGCSEHQVFAPAETGWVGVGRGDLLEAEANTIHLATVQCPRGYGRERARVRVYCIWACPPAATGPRLLLMPGMWGFRAAPGGPWSEATSKTGGGGGGLEKVSGRGCGKAEGSCCPGSSRGRAGVKAGAGEDGAGTRRGRGRGRVRPGGPVLRPRPSRPRRAPRTATHALIRAAVAGATSARPQPAARAPAPAPAPRPPREWNVVCQTGRSARPAHGVGGESEAWAQAQAQAWRVRPQRGRQLGKRRPAAPQAPSGRRGAPATQGARRPAPARARRPSPSPRAAAQLAAKLSPRPPAPGWRPAKLAAAPGREAARPEGAPCAARAEPWPARPRRGPRAAGRECPGPPARASSGLPPPPGPAPRTRGKVGLEPARPVPPGRADRPQEVAAKLFWGVQPVPPARRDRMRPG